MGDAQSAQREAKSDAAAEEEEEREKVSDAETEQNIDDKVLRKTEQVSEINKKADSSIAASNGLCEDEIAVEDAEASKPLKEEETPAENDQIILKQLPDEVDPAGPEEMIEMDAKQNDINESFKKIFSNISLKLTVKRGSTDKVEIRHEPEEDANQPEDIKYTSNEIIEKAQQDAERNAAQDAGDNDSTTYKTLNDVTPPDLVEKTDEKTTETKEEDGGTSPASEEVTPEEEACPTSPISPDEKEITTQFKRFFTTGIFSSFRKRKSLVDDKITGKELLDMGENMVADPVSQDQQHQEEKVSPGVEGATAENLTDEAKPPSIVVNEILDSQEKDKVQASPLKRLMSSSSFKKLCKKQRGRKSSDAKLSDSGEHSSDQLMSSTESADNQKEETSTQPSAKTAGGEEGAWASFKKLMTPQKRAKRLSVDNEEGQNQGLVDGAKPGEGEQVSDHSTEERQKRKDSSVSWEAVLCGSGRRRSRKTSDSDEETPQKNNEDNKRDSGPKETLLGTSNEVQEILASSPKQKGSPPDGDEGSTWKSFKKLVTPKRRVKDEDEINSEVQDDSSFSIKKLLPGKRDRKSAERQDQVSSDEADKEVVSGDEDSETPAVVPLSEFDLAETSVQKQPQADLESYTEKEDELQEDIPNKKTEAVSSHGSETKKIPKNKQMLESEEPEELSESISNHQQLSDITEEGVLTEPSPALIVEEVARDETIAEDLNEITSEAITAPEPLDATLADETEMISAVSQLTDSSKTSGNTTPVPAEYCVMDTEVLLQQVSQTISVRPTEIPVCSEEPSSERVVCFISHQILTTSVTDQPKLLEVHRRSEATALKTGLNTEEIEAINVLAATAQTENISQLSEALSTEIASEVSTEEFDTAEPAADEVYEISISELQESIKESETGNESQHASAVSTENTPKEVVMVQVEKDTLKADPQEEAVVETEDAAGETEVQIPVEEVCETTVPEKVEESLPVLDDLETLTAEAVVLMTEESLKEQSSEDIRPPDTDKEEPKQTEHLTEVTDEKEKKEPETTGAKSDQSEEVSEVQPPPTLELDKSVVSSIKKEALVLENTASAEEDTDEIKWLKLPNKITDEPEDKEPQADEEKRDQNDKEPEVLQAPTLEPEVTVVLPIKKEASVSENITSAEKDTDEIKQVELLDKITDEPEDKEPQPDGDKSDQSEGEPEVLQAPTLEPEEGVVSSIKKEALVLENITTEKDTDEIKQVELPDEPQNRESPADGDQMDHLKVIEEPQVIQAPTLESNKDVVLYVNKEDSFSKRISAAHVDSDDQTQVESLTEEINEPENKEPQMNGAQTDQGKVKGVVQVIQAPTSESKEEASDSTLSADVDEQKRVKTLPELTVESEKMELQMDGVKNDQEVVKAPASDSLEDGVQCLYKEGMFSEVESLTKVTDDSEHKEPQTDAEDAEVTEELKVVQTFESQKEAFQSVNKEMSLSEGFLPAKVDTDELKQLEPIIRVTDESENKDLQAAEEETSVSQAQVNTGELTLVEHLTKATDEQDNTDLQATGAGFDHTEFTSVLEVIQTFTLESQNDAVKSFSEEASLSESILPTEGDTEEQKQGKSLREVTEEQETTEHQVDAPKTEHYEDTEKPEVKEGPDVVQETTLMSEERKNQPLENEVISEDEVPPAENDEPESLTDVNVEVEDGPKSEDVQEPEDLLPSESGSPEALKEDVNPDGSPAVETSTDDPKQTTEVKTESEESLESEVSCPTVKEIITKIDVGTSQPPASENVEESPTQELEKQISLADVPQPEESNIITEETERQCISQLDEASERNKDQETGSVPCDAQVEHEENIPEAVEELQALTAVHVSSINEEPGSAPALETTTCPEKTPEPCADKTEVSDEPTHEVKPCELQEMVAVEKTGEVLHAELKVAVTGQSVVTHKVTQTLKDVSPEKPNFLVQEPLISRIVSETEFNDTVETATLLQRDDMNETTEEGSVVMMFHAPSEELEVNHRIQLQVVDVDLRSAENTVDTVIEVGVTEDKEVIDVCHESIEEVENLSAAQEIEEDRINEEIKVIVQEVRQHVKSDLPERAAGSAEPAELLDVTDGNEINQNTSNEDEDQQIKDEMVMERQDEEVAAVISDGSKADQQDFEDKKQTSRIPFHSIHEHKDESEETKGDLEKSEADVTEKTSTVKEVTMEAQGLQATQNQIATHNSIELATSQNTEVVSSTGNLESPASLSLEFKLNVQFGQANVQTPPSPSTEKTDPMKPAETSETAVQAAAAVEPEPQRSATQTPESKEQAELNEVAAHATEMTEPTSDLDSTQRAVIASRPVLQSAAIQAVEPTEPVEQIQSMDKENLEVQAAEPERQTVEPVEIPSEIRAEEPSEQTEENDQDVWLDAEEDIGTLEGTQSSTDMLDKPVETQSKLKQAEPEPELVCDKESQRDAHKTTGTYEHESEGEDFAVALEDLETSSSAVEWV